MIRVAAFVAYVLAGALALGLLGLGDWDPWAQFGATAVLCVTAISILPGYFFRGEPLPTKRHRRAP